MRDSTFKGKAKFGYKVSQAKPARPSGKGRLREVRRSEVEEIE
jgi:hypothetical protein